MYKALFAFRLYVIYALCTFTLAIEDRIGYFSFSCKTIYRILNIMNNYCIRILLTLLKLNDYRDYFTLKTVN